MSVKVSVGRKCWEYFTNSRYELECTTARRRDLHRSGKRPDGGEVGIKLDLNPGVWVNKFKKRKKPSQSSNDINLCHGKIWIFFRSLKQRCWRARPQRRIHAIGTRPWTYQQCWYLLHRHWTTKHRLGLPKACPFFFALVSVVTHTRHEAFQRLSVIATIDQALFCSMHRPV